MSVHVSPKHESSDCYLERRDDRFFAKRDRTEHRDDHARGSDHAPSGGAHDNNERGRGGDISNDNGTTAVSASFNDNNDNNADIDDIDADHARFDDTVSSDACADARADSCADACANACADACACTDACADAYAIARTNARADAAARAISHILDNAASDTCAES